MALNLAFLNRSYPSLETFKVDQTKIEAFSAAIGDDNEYIKQGFASPTFLISIQMSAMEVALFDPELGLDYSKVVHGEQSFEYKKPVKAGDELSFVSTIEDIKSKVGNDFITIRSDVTDSLGNEVATLKATLIARGTDK
ncbi:MAG: MaoC family dehydratase N-terminal domain-containing protein [Candidatus Nanopelagicales bacterium]|nr:MaoC family dehydratase N-terminal domain-containing protein [Candidatus Nanopelagicales bacterium]